MVNTLLLWRERVHWVRTESHLTVREDDPDLPILLEWGTWERHRQLYVWLATEGGDCSARVKIEQYVGCIPIWRTSDVCERGLALTSDRLRVMVDPADRMRVLNQLYKGVNAACRAA